MAKTQIDLKMPTSDYFRRTENLMRYYQDIRNIPILSESEERALFDLIKHGNKQEQEYAKKKILKHNQRFALAIAKRYANNDNLLDLVNEVNLGMRDAVDNYDSTMGNRFLSFAVFYLRRAVNYYNANNSSQIKKTNISLTYHIASKAANKFLQKYERQPTTEELMDIINEEYNVKIKDSRDLLQVQVASIDKDFDKPSYEDVESGDAALLEFARASSSVNDFEKIESKEFNKKLINKLLGSLSDRDSDIMKMLFGIDQIRPLEITEVAEKLSITPERVRQIRKESLKKLKMEYSNCVSLL